MGQESWEQCSYASLRVEINPTVALSWIVSVTYVAFRFLGHNHSRDPEDQFRERGITAEVPGHQRSDSLWFHGSASTRDAGVGAGAAVRPRRPQPHGWTHQDGTQDGRVPRRPHVVQDDTGVRKVCTVNVNLHWAKANFFLWSLLSLSVNIFVKLIELYLKCSSENSTIFTFASAL